MLVLQRRRGRSTWGSRTGSDPLARPIRPWWSRIWTTLADRLIAAGLEVRPDTELPGVRRCYVDDPFGNRIELIDAG